MASKAHPLESLCELIVDCPHSTPVWTESGFVVLRNQNIRNGRLDLTKPSFTDVQHFKARNRRVTPKSGDLVITREAPMGEVCMIPAGLECCLGQRQVLLRPDINAIDPRFLLYALQSSFVREQIAWNEGTGSTVSNIRIPVLKALAIPTPARGVQEAAADILGALDARIDVLQQTNATLEAIAQALFKSWFMDFEPVHAKFRGRDPEGMDADMAALFPHDFEDSAIGLIPKGWQVASLHDIVELKYGKALKASERRPGDIPVYGSGGVIGAHDTALVNGPTLVVGRKGTVGSLYWRSGPCFPIDTVFYALPKRSLHFAYFAMQSMGLEQLNTDAAVPGLNRDNAYRQTVVLPPQSLLAEWDEFASVMRRRIDQGNERVHSLRELRDTILPRLISGRLRLPGAEVTAEELSA